MKKFGLLIAFLFGITPLYAEDVSKSTAPVSPASSPAPAPAPATRYNEMTGSVVEVDSEERLLRMNVDGGYNVEFKYDSKTKATNGGSPLNVEDLNYGDNIVVRYVGMELQASEIERLRKAPNTLPAAPASDSPDEAHPAAQTGSEPPPPADTASPPQNP